MIPFVCQPYKPPYKASRLSLFIYHDRDNTLSDAVGQWMKVNLVEKYGIRENQQSHDVEVKKFEMYER
jgi:ATP-dependent RNA circularization protein (DNA/RNA ligase family)